MLFASDTILFPDSAEPEPGFVAVEGETIAATGTGAAPRSPDRHLDGLVVPGFVDVHCHGGGGAAFGADDPADAIAVHREHGTTSVVASLVTDSLPGLVGQVTALSGSVDSGDLAGIHLEGPWISPSYSGAHSRDLLARPTVADVRAVLDAGRGTVSMVTIAPELPGALDVIEYLACREVTVAIGHTAADYKQCGAGIGAGATGATHLFNAMPALHHRDPGPVLALVADPRVWLEVVADGIHISPELAAYVLRNFSERSVLVSDAMAGAGAEDGDYLLGAQPVQVRDRVARLAGQDTIAGSTLTMDRAVRNAVSAGVPLTQAVRAATANPAEYLGLSSVGRLAPGCMADLVVLDERLHVEQVMRRGLWLGLNRHH